MYEMTRDQLATWQTFASTHPGAVNRIKAEAPDVQRAIATGSIPRADWDATARCWVRHTSSAPDGLPADVADDLPDSTCDAPVPAGLAEDLSGDAAEPCFLEPGHCRWTRHTNAYVSWPAGPDAPVSQVELILALLDGLSAEDVALIRPLLRLEEMARPDALDHELLAGALASLNGLFGTMG
ncbi:hypothetical protein ACH4OV_20015 [Streptomyces diastaticus]|uniref:hypothetical protein n=1 Tax=Streptomyces diastaticus TaxID=1956 RepID=UPI0037B0C7DC